MSTNLKPYPTYKPSGVEWLGELPSGWDVAKVKYSSYLKARIGWQNLRTDEFVESGPYCVTGTDFKNGRIDWTNCYHVSQSRYELDLKIQLDSNDILITKDGTIGKVAHVEELPDCATLNSGVFVVRPLKESYSTRFMYWILSSNVFGSFIDYIRNGSTIHHLYQYGFERFQFPVPSKGEQHRIARFLDQKTAEIDEAISKKQRLIELLQEQKAILINQAVTKGLNPNVPMRDSGVEWIGEVPAHWDIPPMYARYRIELGKMLDAKRITGRHLVEYLRNTDVQWGTINTNDLPQMDINPAERERYTVKNGDLLVCEGGDIGRCAIWEGVNSEIGYQKALHRMRAFDRKKENIAYLFYVMRAASHSGVFFETAKPNTISHLTGEMFKRYRFPQPPKEEQEEIVRHLRDRECTYHEIVVRELAGIDRLSELKSILISQAVTGKIKV